MVRKDSKSKKINWLQQLVALSILFFFVSTLPAAQVGKFAYKNAPEDLNGKTQNVDGNMVAMSEGLYAQGFSRDTTTASDTPSVFFVIDNSGSMTQASGSTPASDPNGYRFIVTKAFIDTLHKDFPNVEVGLAVFGATLFYDPAKASFITTCPNQTGGYIPLVRLDSTYSAYGGLTGYDIISQALTVNGTTLSTNLRVSNFQTTTNITAGFDAAKNAFLSSLNRKEKQFVLFFSDGMANTPDSGSNRAECFRYVLGANTPTTFTIFFTPGSTVTPPRLDTMTNNIKNNGYSTTNLRSASWGYQNSTQDSLMNFLMNNIFTIISNNSNSVPAGMTVNTTGGGSASAQSYSTATKMFTFPQLFPLLATSTTFNMSITYHLYNKSVYVKDTVHNINNFTAVVNQGTTLPAAAWDVKHWDRDLQFFYNNAVITSATETMDSLEIRFTSSPGDANYNYSNIKVAVSTANGSDNETFTLANKGGGLFSAKFKRVIATSPVPGNRILEQTSASDNIIAVFRNSENPVLPLDTIRVTLSSKLTMLAIIDTALTRDDNHNGLIDNFLVTFDTAVTITSNMTGNFTITYNGVTFPVDSIVKVSDTKYILYVKEQKTDAPQTSWRPLISVSGIPNIETITNFLSSDGCPPVIWRVVKQVTSDDRSKDTVYVYLSEKIRQSGGATFDLGNQPGSTLQIWNYDATTHNDTMLTGIPGFAHIINDSILVFGMSNGHDLTASNWVNIKLGAGIQDLSGNKTPTDNQKVRVTVEGMVVTVNMYPNPSGPTLTRVPDYANLQFIHNPNARTWVNTDHAGIVVTVGNIQPPDKGGKVKGMMKIYDAVGNSVNWMSSNDIFGDPNMQGRSSMDIYWNGLNNQGMKVSPGVYRAVIFLDYPPLSRVRDVKVVKTIGVSR